MRRLPVVLVLMLAVAGCHGDRSGERLAGPAQGVPATMVGQQVSGPETQAPGCRAAPTKAVVKRFFIALSAGRVRDLDEFFAPATRFRWYANAVRPGLRLNDDALDRSSLLGYLQDRQARHERITVTAVHVNTYRAADRSGNFRMLLRRTADDIPGRPQLLAGKGAVDCRSQRLMVVAIGRRP
jgi:hypothetical protein